MHETDSALNALRARRTQILSELVRASESNESLVELRLKLWKNDLEILRLEELAEDQNARGGQSPIASD